MKVHTDISILPKFRRAVTTIGTFDGVHIGHRQIINQLKAESAKIDGETVIITFHPHPRRIVGDVEKKIYLLNTLEEKISLLEAEGIDHLMVVPFTDVFARMTASEYIEEFLMKNFNPHTLIIGYDHRFGKARAGNFQLLEQYASRDCFKLIEIPGHLLHESAISSTRIRHAITEGNVQEANELLGYRYFFNGKVIKGNQLGRTIGYPTANLAIDNADKLIPGNGVYAVNVEVQGESFQGMMNIGVRPTINGMDRVIEVNIFDFDSDIYDQTIRIALRKRLRDEKKFSGLDALKEQLAIDKKDALS